MFKIFSRIKLTYLFTNRYLSLARLVLIQLLLMLRPSWNKVEIKLYQRCFNVAQRRCINVVQRWKSDVGFCFILNVRSTLFQRWSTTLKQRWSAVEMLAGLIVFCKNAFLKNFDSFIPKYLRWILFLGKVAGSVLINLLKFFRTINHLNAFPANICWSWRRLQHVCSVTILRFPRSLEDVLKTSWRHVLKTS